MSQLDVRRLYGSGQVLLQRDLDAFLNDIETFFNITKLNDDNIQDASIDASAKVIAGTITESKFASDAVTTAKIADGAVTTTKIIDDAVTTVKILDANVTADKIADAAITTSKLQDACITYAIKPAINTATNDTTISTSTFNVYAYPASISSFSALTTVGRPVLLQFAGSSTGYISLAVIPPAILVNTLSAEIKVVRMDATNVATTIATHQLLLTTNSSTDGAVYMPSATLDMIDFPSAGTYRYYAGIKSMLGNIVCEISTNCRATELQ